MSDVLGAQPSTAWSQGTAFVQRFTNKSARWLKAYDFIRRRKRSYLNAADYDVMKGVLLDLQKFCRANVSSVGPTDQQTYALIGRREVWLRIQEHLNLSPEQLTDLYYGPDQEP